MKKRRKVKKTFKLFLALILVIGGFLVVQKYFKEKDETIDSEVFNILKDKGIDSSKYSKTLEFVLLNNIYDEKYLDEYKDIEFNENSNFANILVTFLSKGYKGMEINYIFKLSDKNIEILENEDYQDISNYYKIKNFDASKISRYNSFKKENKDYSYEDVVTYVNLSLDLPVYTDTKEVDDPNSLYVLVNKYNSLPNNYTPSDLVYLNGAYKNQVPIREVIKEPFLKLQEAAKKEIGIDLLPTTAFRNQSFQATLYNNYVAKDGVKAADTYSARPGYSEHQTGLAIDLKNILLGSNIRLTDEDYEWLENNAYKYGFIIRFPKDKEFITGYQFENWHIRYVGDDAAKIIYDKGLTLEEYVDLYIKEY